MVQVPLASGVAAAASGARASPASGPSSSANRAKPTANGNGHGPPGPVHLSAMRSAPLDLSSVERRGQPTASRESTKRIRPHKLQEAPTYRPTVEEFKDPFEYMKKITPEASKYGICKIIPPSSWKPDFAVDTERFHFRTRKQELNSVEGSMYNPKHDSSVSTVSYTAPSGTRANLSYLDQLAKFHKQQGTNLNRFPSVDKRPLDLYKLKKAVESRGGFDKVCKLKKWAEIGRDLGYSGKIMSSLSTSLKNSYQRWLHPYEEYLKFAKPGVHQQLEFEYGGPLTPSPANSPVKKSHQNTPSGLQDNSPALRASDALNASVNNSAEDRKPVIEHTPAPVTYTSGFTAVNAGGFTPVNSSPSGFTSVNAKKPEKESDSNYSTPRRNGETPMNSIKNTPEYRPSALSTTPLTNGHHALKRQLSTDSLDSRKDNNREDSDGGGRRSKRLKKDPVPRVAGSHMSMLRPNLTRIPGADGQNPGERCEACGKSDNMDSVLLCDSCDNGYHMRCLDPVMTTKPDYDWHCPRCLVGDGQFGFEEGGIYSLKQFQEKAADFKEGYFQNKMPYDPVLNCPRPVTEDDIEREFWRLVGSLEETVEVEYGADIHSTTHGSGFPTVETHPKDPYSTDPWNLTIMPLHGDSLFRHIKSDISGMTVPWLYVGMIFSTFCWHNEDHYAYSANYQHFGSTKTWYGIPGEDAERFENAMREAVPELFETQPDLLFQLVTLMTPEQLSKAGVRVYALDQRAGQFVITFPQAYHAGFNHGFNFNEAVNFAPTDWEPFGDAGVERLKQFRRQPCFSHDELLWTAAERDSTIQTAKWLAPALERVRDRELMERKLFIGKHKEQDHRCVLTESLEGTGPRCHIGFVVDEQDVSEEEYQCTYCKAYSYLSRFKCNKSGKVMCLNHAGTFECCDMPVEQRFSGNNHTLHYRRTEDAIHSLVQKVVDKAHLPQAWEEKVEKTLEESATPSLKTLKALVHEGERIPFDLPSLAGLKNFVDRCTEWVDEATNYIVRKQQNRRKEKNGRKGSKAAEQEERERELRKVENVMKLLKDADNLGFDCPEIQQLRERADAIEKFQRDAKAALDNVHARSTNEFEELLEMGRGFSVDMPEVEQLETLVQQMKWNDKAREHRNEFNTLEVVIELIKDGEKLGIQRDNNHLAFYIAQKEAGEAWEAKAKELMSVEAVHYPQLEALSNQAQAAGLPVSTKTLAAVDQILNKQREAHKQIVSLYERSKLPNITDRPLYKEVRETMEALAELNSKPNGTLDLEKEQKRHEDWMRRGKKLFGKANAPLHILKSHMEYVLERNVDCFDLQSDQPRQPAEPASREPSPSDPAKMHSWEDPRFREVFCICRRVEAGMMIECELCHEWYHGKCLKIARGKVKEEEKYTCPICDWRVKIPRDAARPKLEDLQEWQDAIANLPFQPDEEEILEKIIQNAQDFRSHVQTFCNPVMTTADEADTQRFFLRKIEGAEILLAYETNFFRQELHKWSPVAPDPPPVLESSKSTRKPRPTKLQKLMAQHGVDDPEQLPQNLRTKPHNFPKRKSLDSTMSKQHQPLKPAPGRSSSGTPTNPHGFSGPPSLTHVGPVLTGAAHPDHQHPPFGYESHFPPTSGAPAPFAPHAFLQGSAVLTGPVSFGSEPRGPMDPAMFSPNSPTPHAASYGQSAREGPLDSPMREGFQAPGGNLEQIFNDLTNQDDDAPPGSAGADKEEKQSEERDKDPGTYTNNTEFELGY